MILLLTMPGGSEWILIFGALGILLIPRIFYLITLQATLEAISPQNRKMPPVNVWLLFIPLFGTIWHFFIVSNLADSIKAEANDLNINTDEQRPGYNVGLAMCILNCLFFFPFAGLAGIICWIVYWVKIAGYKNLILMERSKFNTSTF